MIEWMIVRVFDEWALLFLANLGKPERQCFMIRHVFGS